MLDFEIINRAGIGAFPAVLARILPDLARNTGGDPVSLVVRSVSQPEAARRRARMLGIDLRAARDE